MIYPTRLAVGIAALGVPVALALAVAAPNAWWLGLVWPVAIAILVVVDAALAPSGSAAELSLELPRSVSIGRAMPVTARLRFAGAAPAHAQIALMRDPLLIARDDWRTAMEIVDGYGSAQVETTAQRRGTVRIESAWMRWRGPMKLAWRQRTTNVDGTARVTPDVDQVREKGSRLFERHALQGLLSQLQRGEGTDFDALVEFRPGMDRRAIDWKHSARHGDLHAREYRTEKNSQIVFAIDAGRQMSAPVDHVPRVDRAVSAALVNAWVALKLGDRVAISGFDSRPRVASGFVSGTRGFDELQQVAARIDYCAQESNYTFALTDLAARLNRRSMIVLIGEFTDVTSAEMLMRASGLLTRRHLLLIVILRDTELEAARDARPEEAADVTRAVTADALLRERQVVAARLRHLGAHVIECHHDTVADDLVRAYLDLKRRNLL